MKKIAKSKTRKKFINKTNAQYNLIISFGKPDKNPTSDPRNSIGNYGWGYDTDNRVIKFNNQQSTSRPYIGLIGRDMSSSPKKIIIYGNRIDGTVAAVKRLVSARNKFLTTLGKSNANYLDDYDTLAISVFDLMHRNESVSDYDKDTQGFKDVVQNILNDNNYEISIKTVKTTNDNTTLRLKHLNSDYSPSYKDAVVVDNSPVVLSHGMHSNLFTWNDFATKLAESGRDSWLIEMYGGPTTDSDCKPTGNYYCPNYTFTDLKTYYWPALVAGVQEYSGKNNLSYVGYDLGCTVALESLELYENGKNNAGYYFDTITGNYVLMDLSNKPIDTFVGLGCLGNFTTKFDNESNFVYFVDLINITDYSNSSYIAAQSHLFYCHK